MTRVNINGSNHQVEVQHDGADLAYVIEKAQKLWTDTAPEPEADRTYGYTSQNQLARSGPGWADLRDGERPEVH